MPRIPQNLRERAIGMLNADMTMKAVAMDIGRSTRTILHLRQSLQATGRSTTKWTSSCHDAWLRPLYSEHLPAQSLLNCHSYCC